MVPAPPFPLDLHEGQLALLSTYDHAVDDVSVISSIPVMTATPASDEKTRAPRDGHDDDRGANGDDTHLPAAQPPPCPEGVLSQ